MVEKMKSSIWKIFFMIMALGFILSTTVKAEGAGSIQFYFPKGAAGLEITMYRVAEYDLETFTYTDEFRGNPEKLLKWDNAEEMQTAADTLEKFVTDAKLNGTLASVSADGKISFSGMADGLYLIRQSGSHSGYVMQPALIAVPCCIDTGESTRNVEIYPKVEEKTTEPTDTPTSEVSEIPGASETPESAVDHSDGIKKTGRYVKTGDETPIGFYVGLGLVALCAGGVLYKKKRN